MSDTDDSWLDALAGRAPGVGSAGANPEGASLRAAIQAQRDASPVEIAAEDPQREEALLERARASGLIAPSARSRTRLARLPTWGGWLAAAALACVFVTTIQMRRIAPPSPIVRGAPGGIVRMQSADPVKLKQDLIQELAAAGVSANGYERFGRQGIDADLPAPLPAPIRDILQRHGIAPPASSVLQLEIEPVPPP